MLGLKKWIAFGLLAGIWVFPKIGYANDNAALQYMLAVFANGPSVPMFVGSATTNDPVHGFSTPLTVEQTAFLKQHSTITALGHFDQASACAKCDWGRFDSSFGDSDQLIQGLHQLSRVITLRARQRYESGEWKQANQDVENVLKLARRMVSLSRFYEHYLFMIENIANGTASAYVLQMPAEDLKDLAVRLKNVGVFRPMKQLLQDESKRLKDVASLRRKSKLTTSQFISIVSPYFSDVDHEIKFKTLLPTERIDAIIELSELLSAASNIMGVDSDQAQAELTKICERHSSVSSVFAPFYDCLIGEWKENAQGYCRGTVFRSVVGRLISANNDFSTINDPFGSGHLEYQTKGKQRILLSELVHNSQIDFSFGDAGTK